MPTTAAYYLACAEALDDLGRYTLASSSASTMVISALVNATANASTQAYDDRYVYVPSTAEQVRVRPGGYAPSTGTLTHYPNSSNPGAVAVVLTHLFPIKGGVLGESFAYVPGINAALRMLLVEDEVTQAITTSDEYALSQAWLDRPERLRYVLEPSPIAGRRPINAGWRGWRLDPNGPTSTLRFDAPFSTASGNLTLGVLRPADTLINGADSTTGLVAESDTAVPTIDEVVTVYLMLAQRALMARQPGAPFDPKAHQKFIECREMARALKRYDSTLERLVMAPEGGASRSVLPTVPSEAA